MEDLLTRSDCLAAVFSLVLLLGNVVETMPTKRCLEPPRFHSTKFIGEFPPGGVEKHHDIRLQCREKYYEQTAVSMCYKPGRLNQWTLPDPECQLVECPDPGPVYNGFYQGSSRGVNDTLVYHCDVGFTYIGSARRICQRNGKWSGIHGTCTDKSPVKCPYPEILHILPPSQKTPYDSMATLIMECEDGYIYQGQTDRYCQPNGLWSSTEGECKRITCGDFPSTLENGNIFQCGQQTCKYGDHLNVSCPENYKYHGTIPKCDKDGKWKGTFGSCLSEHQITKRHKSQNLLEEVKVPETTNSSYLTAAVILGIIATLSLLSMVVMIKSKKGLGLSCCERQPGQQPKSGDLPYIPQGYKKLYETWDHDAQSTRLLEWRSTDRDISDIKEVMTSKFYQNENRTILIIGKVGVGKSTLALDVMRNLTQENENVYLLNIRYLRALGTTSRMSMEELLENHSIHKNHHDGKDLRNTMEEDAENNEGDRQKLLHGNSTLVIFIDSLNEFPLFVEKWKEEVNVREPGRLDGLTWVVKILKRDVAQNIRLVISTRSFNGMEEIKPDTTVEVLGLKPDAIANFINLKVERKMRTGLREKIESNTFLQAIASTPLIYKEICHQERNKNNSLDDRSLTYTEIIVFIIESLINWEYNQKKDRRKALVTIFKELPKLAYNSSIDRCNSDGVEELDECFIQDKTDIKELAGGLRSGLLVFKNSKLEFFHTSIKSFFAMVHLVQQNTENIKTFFEKKWPKQSTSESLLYLFGLVSLDGEPLKSVTDDFNTIEEKIMESRNTLFDSLFHQLNKEKEISGHEQLKAIQLIYESQSKLEAQKLCEVLFPTNGEVTEADFQDLTLTDVDMNGILFTMEQLHNQFDLKLTSLDMNTSCQKKLADFLKTNERVRNVSFKHMHFADDGTEAILKAIARNTSLTSCSLQSMHLHDEVMKHIVEALQENKNIEYLCIQKNRFSEVAVKQLADSLQQRTEKLILRLDKEDFRMEEELACIRRKENITIEFGPPNPEIM